ncbi:MAG: hypothetical protein K2H43_04635, partial [Clostridia bacterium]|nr:hypothetical protein [Clostridia bacterium]
MTKLKKAMIAPLVGAMLCGSVLCFAPQTDGGISYAAPASYESLVNVSSQGSGLRIEPSVVFEVKDEADLASIADLRPTTVLLTVDDSLNVTLSDGKLPFRSVFDGYIKGVSIPALRIETMMAALAFQSFMKNTCYISDVMVVSSSLRILEIIYSDEVCYIANGVYDVSDVTLSANRYDFWDYIADANRVG